MLCKIKDRNARVFVGERHGLPGNKDKEIVEQNLQAMQAPCW